MPNWHFAWHILTSPLSVILHIRWTRLQTPMLCLFLNPHWMCEVTDHFPDLYGHYLVYNTDSCHPGYYWILQCHNLRSPTTVHKLPEPRFSCVWTHIRLLSHCEDLPPLFPLSPWLLLATFLGILYLQSIPALPRMYQQTFTSSFHHFPCLMILR